MKFEKPLVGWLTIAVLNSVLWCHADQTVNEPVAKSTPEATPKPSAQETVYPEIIGDSEPIKEPGCPRPTEYLKNGQIDQYISQARAYLKNNPHADAAAMVAHDLIVVATVMKNVKLADEMKEFLLFENPNSFYNYYLLSTMAAGQSYGNNSGNQECARLLKEILKNRSDAFSEEFADKYADSLRAAGAYFGESLLNDNELLLDLALLARLHWTPQAAEWHKDKLLKNDDDGKLITEIALGEWDDKVSILLKLHALKKPEKTDLYRRYFLSQLTEEQKNQPELRKVAIEDLLEKQKFDEALPLAEKLAADQEDPQVLYWLAWCRQSLGDSTAALAELAKIQDKYPESPWLLQAERMAERIKLWDSDLDQHAQAMLEVISKIRAEGIEMFEAAARYQESEKKAMDFYLAFAPHDGHLELAISQNGKMVIGYRTDAHQSRLFLDGEKSIHEYAECGFYPDLKYQFYRDPEGQFGFNFNFNTTNTANSLAGIAVPLQNSPLFQSKAEMLELCKSWLKYGWQPSKVVEDEGGKIYRWVRPKINELGEESLELKIAPDASISRITGETITFTSLHYGRQGTLKFSPPEWPALPTDHQEKVETAMYVKIIGAAVALFAPPEKTRVAERSKQLH